VSLPGRFVTVGGQRIFYHRTGRSRPGRAPIVLVHGYLVSHWQWRRVIPHLAAEHDVIALDLPGFGESDRPPPADFRYDAAAFMDALLGFLDVLNIPRAILVGHSMGAGISLFTAARRPERVEKLVVVDPLVYPYPLPLEGRIILLPFVGERIFQLFYTKGVIRHYLTTRVYRDPAEASGEWIDYLWERVNRPGGIEAAHATLRFCSHPHTIERAVRAVRAPTLVAWGEEDKLFPSVWARRLASDIAGAQTAVVPVCGHAPPEERPAELARLVNAFLGQATEARAA
jgi:pimeloyl-ACP methyl ester carboxylesterase